MDGHGGSSVSLHITMLAHKHLIQLMRVRARNNGSDRATPRIATCLMMMGTKVAGRRRRCRPENRNVPMINYDKFLFE